MQVFEEKRAVMNAACTAQPKVIVVPNTEEDVSIIVVAARNNNLEVSTDILHTVEPVCSSV